VLLQYFLENIARASESIHAVDLWIPLSRILFLQIFWARSKITVAAQRVKEILSALQQNNAGYPATLGLEDAFLEEE